MLKKSISVFLALILALSAFSLVPMSVSAETVIKSGEYSYVLVGNEDDGYTAEITAYSETPIIVGQVWVREPKLIV